jgi:hypothetical protein
LEAASKQSDQKVINSTGSNFIFPGGSQSDKERRNPDGAEPRWFKEMTPYEETLRFCYAKLEKEVAALRAEVQRLQEELQKARKV